jgi:hypothetical protein
VIARDLRGQRLAALAILGWLLLTQPLLSIADRVARVLGIPVLYAWMFGVWALLIVAMAVVLERGRHGTPPPAPRV